MIRIVAVGKTKREWAPVQEHLLSMIRPHDKMEIIEVREANTGNPEKNLEKEKKEIEKNLAGMVVVLDHRGREMGSEEFSRFLEENKRITFVIGGKEGLHEDLKERADLVLSLSRMVFSHQLARIVLLEQVYRAIAIRKNLPFAS